MGKQRRVVLVWKINILSPLQPKEYRSDKIIIGGCKWRALLKPKGNKFNFSYHYLGVADPNSLRSKRTSNVHLHFTIVNRLSENRSIVKDLEFCVGEKSPTCCYPIVLLRSNLIAEDGGFLKNGKLKVVLRVKHEYKATENLKKSVDVNGFQVFPSHVGSVKRIHEKHPHIASEVRPKKQCLRTTNMNVILGQIETLCQFPGNISDDDLEEAFGVVSNAAKGSFIVDWLEKKLEEVKEKKKKVNIAKARLQQIEEELQKLNQK